MKYVIVISFLVAAVMAIGDYSDPAHPGKCVYKGDVLDIGINDNLDPITCLKFECLAGGKGTPTFCPGEDDDQVNCKTGKSDPTLAYPACCACK